MQYIQCICCCCSVIQLCSTLCGPMDCSMPDFLVHHNSWSLLKLMSIELVMPSNHLILYHLLLLLPLIFPSIEVFSNESVLCIRQKADSKLPLFPALIFLFPFLPTEFLSSWISTCQILPTPSWTSSDVTSVKPSLLSPLDPISACETCVFSYRQSLTWR